MHQVIVVFTGLFRTEVLKIILSEGGSQALVLQYLLVTGCRKNMLFKKENVQLFCGKKQTENIFCKFSRIRNSVSFFSSRVFFFS